MNSNNRSSHLKICVGQFSGFLGTKKKAETFVSTFVENTGFEPVTSCLPGKRSSQMS